MTWNVMSSAITNSTVPGVWGKSCIKIANRRGLKTDPCGTPVFTESFLEQVFPIITWKVLFSRRECSHFKLFPLRPRRHIL